MKKVLFFAFAVMMTFFVSAQTIVFHENFELPSLGDSLVTTADSNGFATTSFLAWAPSTQLFRSGARADSNILQTGKTIYFTTNSFSTLGNTYVILEFSQICKLYFADGGIVETSIDGGITWTSLGTAQYLGTGNLISSGGVSKFSDNAYIDWVAGSNAIPTNAWWKDEKFDISSIVANQANVKIRFKFTSSGQPSGIGRYGWLLDDIKVTISPSELNPPVITMISYPIDTVYHNGPYNVSAYVKDASGIDTVFILYKVGSGALTQLGMVKSPVIDSLYTAGIPYVGYGRTITYNITARDASGAHNPAYKPVSGNYTFFTKFSPGGNVIVGVGTSTQNYPFKSNADFTKSAALYLSSTINRFGLITSLQWNVTTAQATIPIPVKIYLKQTTTTAMTADNWTNLTAGAILVYDGIQTFTTTGWKTINLTTPFNYNSGNLMVLCEANNGTAALASPNFSYSTGTTGTHQFFASSSSVSGSVNTQRPNITIGFVVVPVPTQDAGIAQIVNPSGSVIAGTAFDVNVKIKNFGSDTLRKATIYYTIDGGAPVSTVWNGPSLLKDSSVVYTAGNLNLSTGIHALKVWTSLPNDSIDQNFANDTSGFSFYACSGPLNGIYTVGGATADFPTFADVFVGLSQCGITGPVTFMIAPGTYSDQLTLPEIVGSSATNTITFQSVTNDSTSVIMNHTSTAAANWIFKLNGTDNIIFKNIKFAPADSLYSTAIVMTNGATNNQLIGNLFVGYGGTAVSLTMISIEGTTLANAGNAIKGNYIIKGSYGISIKGTSGVKLKNTVIKNNTIDNSVVYGIYAQFVDSTLIDSNTVNSSIINTASKYGIYLQNGNILNKITKNTVILTGGTNMYGILAETCVSTDTTKGLIANNFVSLLNGTSFAYGIRLNTVTKFKVYANSVVTNGNNATDTRAINIVSTSVGNDLKNNNLLSNKYPIYIEGTTSVSSSNYNNYFSTGTSFAFYNTTAYTTLAAFVTASLKDSNSVSANPYFLSLTNLHTFNGLLKGMGTNLADVTTDIDGAPRLSPPCIGADEFLPPSQDATLISIMKPTGGCGLTSAEDVKVIIKNVGSDIILPNTMTARYKLDSLNPVVSELVNRTMNPGDTIQYIFTTKVNIALSPTLADTSFKIRAWTDLTGDFAHANDSSATLTFTSMYLPTAPSVTNASTYYLTSATLNAVSNRPIYWYYSDTSTVSLYSGASYTTPPLYATHTYYVEAKTSQSFNAAVGTATTSQVYPFYAGWGFTRSSSIYLASEIGSYGVINQLQFNVAITSSTVLPIKIYLKQTPLTSQTADTWANITNGATLVFDGTKTFDVLGWKTIDLSSSFNYTSGNLMVLCEANQGLTGTTTSYFQYTTAGAGTHQYNYADNSPPTTTGFLSTSRPNIIFAGNIAGCVSPRVPVTATVIIPAREAGISSVIAPTGCALYQVPVSIKIFNHGSDTLKSTNTTVKYKIDNGSFIAAENINVVIPPFDTVQYTFTTLADFSAPTSDRYIKVTAVVLTPGDVISGNDTLVKDSVLSRFTPPIPTANNINIFYGDHATLTASATVGNILWFDQPVGGNSIGQGSPFTTALPIYQYPADTFYVEASTNYAASATVGTGTIVNSTTVYPTPYGQWYNGSKEQYLIRASELTALGLTAGVINSIGFDVVSYTGAALVNFTIKIGQTNLTALSAWITGLTSVYSNASVTPTTGWNTYNFTTPFVWDGVSSVVIEACFNNYPNGYTTNAVVHQSSTSFVSTLNYHSDTDGSLCNPGIGTPTTYSQRPNIQLQGMVPGCSSIPRVQVIVTVSPPPQNDAGVTALINPVGSTPSGVSTPIKVKIKNFGQASLTTVAVAWTINGVAKPVYNFTGNVPTGTDTIVTISNETFSGGLYCVKAWTEHPNAAPIDSVSSNDTLFSTCFTVCLNGTYTIGNTVGGNYDFPSFNSAVSTLKIGGVCGSVTFLVDTGTYTEQVRITQIAGVSAINTITFRSASNDSTKVILQNNAVSTANYTLQLDSADYIRIQKMTIKALSLTYGYVIELKNGATYNIISNNIIENPVTTSFSSAGIYDYTTPNYYNKYQNNIIRNGYYGIYTQGSGTTTLKKGVEITDNKILNFYYYGIYSWYQDSVKIIGNEINSNSTNTFIYGLYMGYNQNAIQVIKNKVILTTPGSQYAMYIYFCSGTATAHGVIANNMIALSGGTTTSTNYGLYPYYSNYQDFYFNSVGVTVPSLTNGRALYHYYGTNQTLKDNSFVNTGGGFAYYVALTSAITLSDYNNIYTTGTILAYWNANRNTLSDLQAASTFDANSVSVDPLYTSATDLHLLSTGLSAIGTPVAGITDDIDGFVRNPLHPTIGADEVPLLQFDAGVTIISRPAAVETEAASFPVKVTVKNFGTDTITSMTVSYVLNNGTPVTFAYTGSIPSFGTDTVTFPSNMIVTAGNNTICAYTTLTGDFNTFNNQTCKNFWGSPLYDAQLAAISPIPGGCNLTTDSVRIMIVNQGIMPINGGLTASYQKLGFPGIITETVSTPIAVGGNYLYTFTTPVNLAVTTSDVIYQIKAWVTLTNDNMPNNNNDTIDVQSLHTPLNPVTAPSVSIPYATTASLTALSPDPLKWYDVATGGTSIFTGSPFVTPMLFATDSFYVEANTSYSALVTVGTGTITNGTTGYPSPYGQFYNGAKEQYLLRADELTALGLSAGIINTLGFDVVTAAGAALPDYTVKIGSTSVTALSAWITGLTTVYSNSSYISTVGWNYHNFTTPFNWDGVSNIVIEVCFNNYPNGYTTNASVNQTATSFVSTLDYHSDGDGSLCNPGQGTPGTYSQRPNMKLLGMVPGCSSSPRIRSIVNVGAQPALDASAVTIISPVTGVNLTTHDTVRVLVKNYGFSPIVNFPVKYQLGSNPVVSQNMTDTIFTDSVKIITFLQTVNLSSNNQPDTFKLTAWTDLVGDPTHQNDTTKKTVINNPPVYCISSSTSPAYEDVINVSLNTLNNTSSVLPAGNMYTDFTSTVTPTNIQPGMTYPLSITTGFPPGYTFAYTCWVNMFIDYNRNGVFETNELVYSSTTTSNNTVTGTLTVPYTAIAGLTRMRVVMRESGTITNTGPCGTYTWGETEDYTVRIIPPIPHDAGITKLSSGTFVPYTVNNPITPYFYIRNYGSDTLNTANINYIVNNGIVQTYAWTPSSFALQSLEIDSVQHPVTLAYGMNTITSYTNGIVGDTNYLNDTLHSSVFKEYGTTLPYTDNFEVNKYWFASDTAGGNPINNLWEQGIPSSSSPSLNAVHSPVNAWVTGLSSNYTDNNYSVLYSPVFDISVLKPDTLKFWHWINAEANFDGGHIEYLNDVGGWTVLGHYGDTNAINWYNDTSLTTPMWSGTDTIWKQSMYKVSNLFNSFGNTLQFKYVFTSDAGVNSKGWAIDDFVLTLAPIPNDAGVIAIAQPTSISLVGDIVAASVTVKNFGTGILTNIPVTYKLAGIGSAVTEFITGPLAPGATTNHLFTQTYQVGVQSYTIHCYTGVAGDYYIQNDTTSRSVTVNPAANDVGVTQIITPGASVSPGGTAIVKVRIKNFGTQTQTSIPVTFIRPGGSQGAVTGIWTGSLVSGATVDYTFSTQLTLPSGGTSFNLRAYTSLNSPSDAYRLNDTLSKSVVICNVAAAGSITGPHNVTAGSTVYNYSVNTIANATSYNWVYTPSTGVIITGTGASVTITFDATAVNGALSVNGVGSTCEGTASTININLGVGIDDLNSNNDLWLGQNIPNPTTGLTNIEYNLPSAGEVKFDIMNLLGQKVYSTNEKMVAGKHYIDLNVKDLAAGIYYYSIEFKDKQIVKKMIVNK